LFKLNILACRSNQNKMISKISQQRAACSIIVYRLTASFENSSASSDMKNGLQTHQRNLKYPIQTTRSKKFQSSKEKKGPENEYFPTKNSYFTETPGRKPPSLHPTSNNIKIKRNSRKNSNKKKSANTPNHLETDAQIDRLSFTQNPSTFTSTSNHLETNAQTDPLTFTQDPSTFNPTYIRDNESDRDPLNECVTFLDSEKQFIYENEFRNCKTFYSGLNKNHQKKNNKQCSTMTALFNLTEKVSIAEICAKTCCLFGGIYTVQTSNSLEGTFMQTDAPRSLIPFIAVFVAILSIMSTYYVLLACRNKRRVCNNSLDSCFPILTNLI